MSLPSVKRQEKNLPTHVAIIMDGNRRWAQARKLPYIAGHHEGVKVMRTIVESAAKMGLDYLTLFAFSTENWFRPASWVHDFTQLLEYYLQREVDGLVKNNVILKIIGDRAKFSEKVCKLLDEAEEKTAKNTGLTLIVALSYSGRHDITQMVKQIACKVENGALAIHAIDEQTITEHLLTNDIPDPDLLIRTSGEYRLSNFLLWQFAYSELYFTNTYWPDFTEQEFSQAINHFLTRERRYGKFSA